jgi:hypothetical protein
MKLTRRTMATALASSAALAAQEPAPPAPDEDLKQARDRMQANAATLNQSPIPMATEPAFQFKA